MNSLTFNVLLLVVVILSVLGISGVLSFGKKIGGSLRLILYVVLIAIFSIAGILLIQLVTGNWIASLVGLIIGLILGIVFPRIFRFAFNVIPWYGKAIATISLLAVVVYVVATIME